MMTVWGLLRACCGCVVVSWGGVLFENSIVCFFGFEQIVFVWKCDTNYFIYFLIDDRLWFQLCQRGSCTPVYGLCWCLRSGCQAFCFVTESLILAQDERWRRA